MPLFRKVKRAAVLVSIFLFYLGLKVYAACPYVGGPCDSSAEFTDPAACISPFGKWTILASGIAIVYVLFSSAVSSKGWKRIMMVLITACTTALVAAIGWAMFSS